MSKNSVKVLAALLIWVTAGYLAYSYYKRLFPELPNRRGRAGAGRNWEHPDKEIAAFVKADPPKELKVKVRRSKPGSESDDFQTVDRRQSTIQVVKGVRVAEAYARLRGVESWKVTQLPRDMNRWDVFARTPARESGGGGNRPGPGEQREAAARQFLSWLKWEVKTGKRPATRYRFRKRTDADGPAPTLTEFASRMEGRGMRWRPELGQVFGLVSRFVSEPVVMDCAGDVRRNRPNLPENQQLRVPSLTGPEDAARFLCALYGVAFDKTETKADAFLVYHPKYARPEEIRAWEAGEPVTPEEKARAEEAKESGDAASDEKTTDTAPAGP